MGRKNPKFREAAAKSHRPEFRADPDGLLQAPIAWNFHRMDYGGSWPCSLGKLARYSDRLSHFERRTARDIFQSGDRHSHPTGINNISPKAQSRLDHLGIDAEVLYQLSLSMAVRLWGIMELNIFHIIWLDENHTVCPSGR